MKAVRIHQVGGPETLRYEEISLPEPGPGEARVKIEASGLNFIDVYHRTGIYPVPLPFTLGMEGAGAVEAAGPGVTEVKPGDRVAYAMQLGSHAEYAIVPAAKLVPLPAKVDTRTAAAALLQGMTAHYLVRSTYPLQKGDLALVHAAAGGAGLMLVQAAKRLGATVFGTVSTEKKARLAKEAGADEVILYTETDFVAEIKKLTSNRGVHVVYDSVGKSTFDKSLDCLRPRGYLVLFGNSSGPVAPFNVATLVAKGSLFVTRPSLAHYMLTREELLERASELFDWISSGAVKARVEGTYPFADVAEAHRQLEARQTMGKVLLLPS
jgi:NADPH:quinone reductase